MKFVPKGDGVQLADEVEEVVRGCNTFGIFIQLVKNFVRDPSEKIQRSVVSADRVAV